MHRPAELERVLTGPLLALIAGLAALGSLATNIILPAFPAMGAELDTSVKALSATLGTCFVSFAIGQLFAGPLSDRFGRSPLVLGGLAVFVVGSTICALASSLSQLITGRVVQAVGVCATSVLSRAIARDLSTSHACPSFDGHALRQVSGFLVRT